MKLFILLPAILISKICICATPVIPAFSVGHFIHDPNFKSKLIQQDPTAKFDSMWVDFNASENGKKGMLIHVKFSIQGMKDKDCDLAVYFKKRTGEKVKGLGSDTSTTGQAAIYKSLKPGYDDAIFDDMQLFMPYGELDIPPGKNELTMEVNIIYSAGGVLKALTNYDFWINQ